MPSGAASAASAGATIGSSLMGFGAAGKAGKAAANAANANTQFINGVYGSATNNLTPTIDNGKSAGNALSGLLGIGGNQAQAQQAWDNYRNSTNYNFLFDQGTQAVKTANAPSFNSGATAKALVNYGQGMAGNALSGYEGLLQGQQQLGAQSALGLGQIGSSLAGPTVASNNANAGAQGSSALAGAGALSGGLNGLNSVFQNALTGSSFKAPTDAGTFAGVTPGDFGSTPSFNVTGLS